MDFTASDHLKSLLDAHHVLGSFTPVLEFIAGLVKESFEPDWFALLGKGGAN